MINEYPPLLEELVHERRRRLLQEAEHERLVRAAAPRGRRSGRGWGVSRLARAGVYSVGALLVSCGAALVRWSACNKPLHHPLQQGA